MSDEKRCTVQSSEKGLETVALPPVLLEPQKEPEALEDIPDTAKTVPEHATPANLDEKDLGSQSQELVDYSITGEKVHKRKSIAAMYLILWAHHYWWAITFLINAALIAIVYSVRIEKYMGVFAIGNLLVTVLVRNEILLSGLYWFVVKGCFLKFHLNRLVHSIGGLHVAGAISTFVWITMYVVYFFVKGNFRTRPYVAGITACMLPVILLIIIITAIPIVRHKFHNVFEMVHRFLGWASLAILVVHVFTAHINLQVAFKFMVVTFFKDPVVYLTLAVLISVFTPWMIFKRVKAEFHLPSPAVALITLPGYGPVGTFARISTNLIEWHAFSCATNIPDQRELADIGCMGLARDDKFQLIVAAAGDWTKKLIKRVADGKAPSHLFLRRVKPPGFMYAMNTYEKVICVATGAGIAPVLPHVIARTCPMFVIWVAKKHKETYGDLVYNDITSLEKNCLLYDTGVLGRPYNKKLILDAVRDFNAQAVFVVSNEPYTKDLMNICWKAGVPCYGATRDS